MRPRARAAILITFSMVLAVGAGGLIAAPNAKSEEIEQLKQEVFELKKRATVAELENGRLQREIARLEAELERASGGTRPTGTPEPGAPEAVSAELEPTDPETIGLSQKIEETDLDDLPVVELPAVEPSAPPAVEPPAAEALDAAPPAAAPPAASPAPELVKAPAAPSAEAQALYDEGYTLFNEQRYADAEARFDRYVKLHPQTDLADNALFWIGECRYARGDFSSALEAFTNTVARYPDGNKVADALFKAGKCLESLGDAQKARGTYKEVIDRYPGTSAAARAHEHLAGLS